MDVKDFNWGPGIFMITYHLLLFMALPFYFVFATVKLSTVITAIVLLFLTEVSVTAGYHRFYAHRSYKPHKGVEAVMLFFATMAFQSSALFWSHDHRKHHAFVDTDRDPYSIKKGFWYAHMGWIFEKRKKFDTSIVQDLMKNPWLRYQHNHYVLFAVASNTVVFFIAGVLLQDMIGAFVLVWWLRLFFTHHLTWFINSLAHTWGAQTFSTEFSAVDNYAISMLTCGEGYHNYHHTFASDYRNGIKWYHFDPTKWLIWSLAKCGLASDLNTVNIYTIKKTLILHDKDLLLNRLKHIVYAKKGIVEKYINKMSEQLTKNITNVNSLLRQYRTMKKEKWEKAKRKEMKLQIKLLRKCIKKDMKSWSKLCKFILRLKPQVKPQPKPQVV